MTAALAGLAQGVWKAPREFLAGRRFQRFLPGANARAAGRARR